MNRRQTMIRLDDDLYAVIAMLARIEDRSVAGMLNHLVREKLRDGGLIDDGLPTSGDLYPVIATWTIGANDE